LEELHERFAESSFRADALFLAGLTETKLREFGRAEELFEQVETEFPDFRKKDEILFTRAESAAAQLEKTEAVRLYEQVASDYPKSRFAEDASRRVGQLYFEEGDYDSAAVFFGRLLDITRDEERRIEAAILQAQTLIRLDRADEAITLLEAFEPQETPPTQTDQRNPRRGVALSENFARVQMQEAAALGSDAGGCCLEPPWATR
jgi:TolA-binding protein